MQDYPPHHISDTEKLYSFGHPLDNLSELGSDTVSAGKAVGHATYYGAEAVGTATIHGAQAVGSAIVKGAEVVGNAAIYSGKKIGQAGKAVGGAVWQGGVASAQAAQDAYGWVEDRSFEVEKRVVKSIAKWSTAKAEELDPSPVKTPNEQITENMF